MYDTNTMAFVAIVFLVLGCHHKERVSGGGITAKGITVTANWVKPKGKKFDVELVVGNQSGKPAYLPLGELTCSRGGTPGTVHDTNVKEVFVIIPVGASRSFVVKCTDTAKQGAYGVTIGHVYEATANGHGGAITDNLTWIATGS